VSEQRSGSGNKQYARKLPKFTQEQIIAQARQQAIQEADPSYSGHSAGIHPENQPYMSQDLTHSNTGRKAIALHAPERSHAEEEDDLEEDESYYTTRLPTSARWYPVSPEHMYQDGNTRYHVRYIDVPKRTSRQPQLPAAHEIYEDEYKRVPQDARVKARVHPLVWFGIFGIFLILGWIGLNFATSWYQGLQDDWTYGKQRHFEIDAVVGHADSQQHPSHFTAENNSGQIIVIELPGGDVSHARIYQIETVPGNAGNPPVKLAFADMNGDGKPDMIVQIGDGSSIIYLTLWNNGSQFVSKL
jgi:hypothetical protein